MQTAAVSRFLRRRVTRIGLSMIAVTVISGAMSIGKPVSSLFQILSFCFIALLFSFTWTLCRRAKLQAVRTMPMHGAAGLPVKYAVEVTNIGKRSISDAWLTEPGPDPRPTLQTFTSAREPGEEKRNIFDRTFRFYRWMWLVDQREDFADTTSREVISLKPGESMTVTLEWIPLKRGLLTLGEMRVMLPDPFGLFQRSVKVPARESQLLIYPERHPMPEEMLPGGDGILQGGNGESARIGNSDEFAALRDYQPGDPIRHIHWRSWARTGSAVVREFEDHQHSRYLLFIDTFPGQSRDPKHFENSLRVATGLATSLDQSRSQILQLVTCEDSVHINAEGEKRRTTQLMRSIAGLYPGEKGSAESAAALVLDAASSQSVTSGICLMSHWDEERKEFVDKVIRAGFALELILVDVDTESLARHPVRAPHKQVNLA